MKLLKFILIPAIISYAANLICLSNLSWNESISQNHECCKGKDQDKFQETGEKDTSNTEHTCTCKFHCCHQPYISQSLYQPNFKTIQEDIIHTQEFHPNIFEVELFKPPSFPS